MTTRRILNDYSKIVKMKTENNLQQKTIRELMPDLYLPTLIKRSGLSKSTIYRAVHNENKKSQAWPFILELAREKQEQEEVEQELRTAGVQN